MNFKQNILFIKKEFLIAVNTTTSSDITLKLKLAFDLYDSNDSGKIDQTEMAKILTAIYDIKGVVDRKGANDPKVRTAEIFAKMDTNYSNSLDQNEFVQGCMKDPVLMKFLMI